jgi:hypothetical protein
MGNSKALSLHIGLNRISKNHYGQEFALYGCENDAEAMQRIAVATGYAPTKLLNEQATAGAILNGIRNAARSIAPGGIFLLTYAGHGSQIEDLDGDELKGENGSGDGRDETWCAYDRMIADDELYRCWAEFPRGARIIFLSDSCHSGTMARAALMKLRSVSRSAIPDLPRAIDPESASRAVTEHFEVYRHLAARSATPGIAATVILLSGCQDNQTSSDGAGGNGRFTTELLKVWSEGRFRGDYREFHKAISRGMPSAQQPNYMVVGASNREFEAQTPFTIDNTGEKKTMNTNNELSERVKAALGPRLGAGAANGRGISGGCSIGISFDRDLVAGLDDKELLRFFQEAVAPQMMDNWLTVSDQISPLRGGEISCTATTGGGGGISCTGTIRF